MTIRKFGTGEVLGTPATEGDEQGISRTAQHQVEQEPWTEQDSVELTEENKD